MFSLADNAVHYTQKGGRVTIQVSADYDWAVLTVTDNGSGIPPEVYTRVLEHFTRLNGMQTRGIDPGLAIAW